MLSYFILVNKFNLSFFEFSSALILHSNSQMPRSKIALKCYMFSSSQQPVPTETKLVAAKIIYKTSKLPMELFATALRDRYKSSVWGRRSLDEEIWMNVCEHLVTMYFLFSLERTLCDLLNAVLRIQCPASFCIRGIVLTASVVPTFAI